MEPPKANTVGIVKNSPSLRTTRKTLQFFRACSGLFFFPRNQERIINQTIHYYLSYPIYGSNQRHKANNVKNVMRSSAVFTCLAQTCIWEIIPRPNPEDFTCNVASKHGLRRRMPGYS